MGIVCTLFVVGGNMEKLVCEPLANRQIFKVLRTNPPFSPPPPLVFMLERRLSELDIITYQHCCSVLMNMCVFVDYRHPVPGSSCQEELPSWAAVSESKHRVDFGKHVQVTCHNWTWNILLVIDVVLLSSCWFCFVGSATRTTVCITLCSWKPCSTSTPSSTELWCVNVSTTTQCLNSSHVAFLPLLLLVSLHLLYVLYASCSWHVVNKSDSGLGKDHLTGIRIEKIVDVFISPQYNKDLANVFESVQVDLQDITLLEQAGRDNLINFANSGIGQINYEAYLMQVICVMSG